MVKKLAIRSSELYKVDLEIGGGEYRRGLIKPNGAGKTLPIRMLAAAEEPFP